MAQFHKLKKYEILHEMESSTLPHKLAKLYVSAIGVFLILVGLALVFSPDDVSNMIAGFVLVWLGALQLLAVWAWLKEIETFKEALFTV